jgi:hypothetical protein
MANPSTDDPTPAAAPPRAGETVESSPSRRANAPSVIVSTTIAVVGVSLFVAAAIVGTSLLQRPPLRSMVHRSPRTGEDRAKDAFPGELALRRDFPIAVELDGSTEGPGGGRLLPDGSKLACSFEVGRNAYVGVWMISADGSVLQLFPSKLDGSNFVRAGAKRTAPTTLEFAIPAEAAASPGQIRVLASEYPWEPAAGNLQGPYTVFMTDEEQRGWLRQVHSLTSTDDRSHGLIAEFVLPFRVTPAESVAR